MKLTTKELRILAKLSEKDQWNGCEFNRRSDREGDIDIRGNSSMGRFSAWLVLAAIRELTQWTSRRVASMTDYPEMAMSGDWSGVRDTADDKLWEIFDLI